MTTHVEPNRALRRHPEGLYDDETASQYLRTTPRHVRELWSRKQLAAVKVGRLVRYRQEDLDEYIRRNRVPAAS